jgi:hypothetical protein
MREEKASISKKALT